jgi:Rha family phage regulatory protein
MTSAISFSTPASLPTIPLIVHDGEVFCTSKIVAEYFDKNHQHVLEKIRKLDCSEAFGRSNFRQSSYLNMQGKEQPLYELTRDGFMFLAMGFTGPRAAAVKEAFIAQFNQMESMLRGGSALPAMAQSLTQTQALLAQVAERQAATDDKVNAILSLVDVAGKYISLLEANQKPKPRALRAVTPVLEQQIRELLAQGMPGAQIARLLEVSTATVSLIKNGKWSSRATPVCGE